MRWRSSIAARAREGARACGRRTFRRRRAAPAGASSLRLPERGDRPHDLGAVRLRLPGARRRQRRDPPPVRHGRAEGALPAPARRGRGALVLLDDRARGAGLRPDDAAHPRRARRRRLGDRRPQVVLVGRRGRGVRDRDGGHRPGRAPARAGDADPRSGRHARRRGRPRRPDDGARRPWLVDPLRGALHERPRAGREHARRRGRRLHDRPEAARPRPHPPRDALARPDAARVRADVHATRSSARRSAARSPTSRPCRTGSPTAPPRSTPAG